MFIMKTVALRNITVIPRLEIAKNKEMALVLWFTVSDAIFHLNCEICP